MKHTIPMQLEQALMRDGTPTLARVIQEIRSSPDLSDGRRRDMVSGLRRIASALGRDPSDIPAVPKRLQPLLAKVMPAALGITDKSWQNAVSDAKPALANVGVVTRRSRHLDDLSAPWRELWQGVLDSKDKSLTVGLGRFVHFLSAGDVDPGDASQCHTDPARKAGRIPDSRVLHEAALRHAGPELDREPTALQRAKRLRDAAMLTMMPIRHRAFAALQLGTTLMVDTRALTIILPGDLTKTGNPWESELPEPAAGLLRGYLSEARPYLLARSDKAHDMLWGCNNGDPMSYSYIDRRISQITQVSTSKAIPAHFSGTQRQRLWRGSRHKPRN